MKLLQLTLDSIVTMDNVRKDITKESISSLIASVKDKGVLQPLLVKQANGKYELIAGYRRFNAAKYAGLNEVPALIIDIGKDERIEYQLTENLQRKDLNPVDEAAAYQDLQENYTIKDLIVITGKSEYYIRRMLTLLRLCPELQEALKKGELSAEHGFVLARLSDARDQRALAKEIRISHYSPARAENELSRYSHRLETALFDKKDCANCTFNGSTMKDLFDRTNDLSGTCLNADCYFKKISEVQKQKESLVKKAGKKVIVVKQEPSYGSKEYEAFKDMVDFTGYEAQSFDKEKFKTECSTTCPTFAIVIGPNGQDKSVCLNKECFARALRKSKAIERKATSLPKTGDPEKDASIQFEARQKETRVDTFKRDFFIKGLREKLKDTQLNRLILHALFEAENGGSETISELLKADKKQQNYLMKDISRIWEFSNDKLLNLIKQLILNNLNNYDTSTLQLLSQEAGLDIAKQFVISQEYLEKFSKAGLLKLANELKLKIGSLVWKDKKSEIIKTLLGSGIKGRIPKEMLK